MADQSISIFTRSQGTPGPTPQMFKSLKEMIYELSASKCSATDRRAEEGFDRQLEQTKMITSLNHELSYLKEVVASQEKKIQDSEENWDKTTKEIQSRHRKEIKKYIDLVSERENEIENLKKSLKSLTNRSLSLTTEIQALNQSKAALENTILKSIESIRSNIKEFNYSIQENELDKVVLEGKYKQLCDKVEQVVRQSQQCEQKKSKVERKYQRLKENYQGSQNECIELKFEVERYKIKVKDLSDAIEGRKENRFDIRSLNMDQNDKMYGENVYELKEKVSQIVLSIKTVEQKRERVQHAYNLSQRLEEMIKQNENLKLLLQDKEIQNDELRLKLQGNGYKDSILKNRNPSLFELLLNKKEGIQEMETRIQKLERLAISSEELLKRKLELNTQSICNQENKAKEKQSTQQLVRELQLQKEGAIAKQREACEKLRDKDRARMREMEDICNHLKKQNERLKGINEGLERDKKNYKNLLDEMVNEAQPKKKKSGKTKPKLRCSVCFTQFTGSSKINKCTICLAKMHIECTKNHECKQNSEPESSEP